MFINNANVSYAISDIDMSLIHEVYLIDKTEYNRVEFDELWYITHYLDTDIQFLTARYDGKLIGYIAYVGIVKEMVDRMLNGEFDEHEEYFTNLSTAHAIYISSLVVLKEYRHNGIGKTLITECLMRTLPYFVPKYVVIDATGIDFYVNTSNFKIRNKLEYGYTLLELDERVI